jgi:hypothetical protein
VKESVLLTIASLLSILFSMFHLADDINRGMSPGGLTNLIVLPVFVVFLYAALVLPGRRSGYVILLLESLLLMVIPVIHMRGRGIGFGTNRSGGLFFVWTLLAIGVTSLFSVILSVRGLWSLRRREPR